MFEKVGFKIIMLWWKKCLWSVVERWIACWTIPIPWVFYYSLIRESVFYVHGNSVFDFSRSVKYAFTYMWFGNQRFARDWLFQFLVILASFKGKLGAKGVRPASSLATFVRIEDWELTFTRQLLNQEGLKLVWHTCYLHSLCTVTCHTTFESQW